MDMEMKTIDLEAKLPTETEDTFSGTKGTYGIIKTDGGPLVETEDFKLYVAKLPTEPQQLGLMMIANTPEDNQFVAKQAHILTTMQEMSNDADEKAKIKPNYGAFFPTVFEYLLTDEAQPRAVIFMGYNPVISTYKQLVPLSVALKDQRIDLQTGLWLLGKSLKLLSFVHAIGFAVGFVDESNILIETALHGVFVLDWTYSLESEVTDKDYKLDIKDVAKIVWRATGGNDESDPPYDESIMSKAGYDEFITLLKRLMSGETKGANEEMITVYQMADRIWERVPDEGGYNPDGKKRPFHEWITYPISK